jgi:hypothetical protein
LISKERRELYVGDISHTNQFEDELTTASIFPRHRFSDEATKKLTIEKRLVFKSPSVNYKHFKSTNTAGLLLFDSLVDVLKLTPTAFNPDLFSHFCTENERVMLSKDIPALFNSQKRRDPDWPLNYADLFIKSQLCTKLEKMYIEAKAGQTLTSFHSAVLLYLGPVSRYIQHLVNLQKPDTVYLHSQHSEEELNSFVLEHWHTDNGKMDDFESFDQSQNGDVLNFECHLMSFFGIPTEFINFYVNLKINCRVHLGNLQIMRLTGEFCTFNFNTLSNLAYQNLRYDLTNHVIMIGGDDSCIDGHPLERPSWRRISNSFGMVSKFEYSQRPIFCGWIITKYGIIKHPKLLFSRLMAQSSLGNIDNCVLSYSAENRFAYYMGDRLYDFLEYDELEYQSYLNRYFIKHSSLSAKLMTRPPLVSHKALSKLF